jgi:aspartate dehydrogenase
MSRKLAIGLVGAGVIGHRVVQAIAEGEIEARLTAVCDHNKEGIDRLRADYGPRLGEFLSGDVAAVAANCDVMVEAAAGSVVPEVVRQAREAFGASGKRPAHLLVMSVGGLLQVADLFSGGPVIHVPSGALGGLDAIQALAVAGLDEVMLTTSKPPAGLGLEVKEFTVLFEGSARDVIAKYPKNVNVAVALSFAGLGPDRTMVRLVADPAIDRNTHHVIARGPAGEVEFTSRNLPFPENPATSYLAALSAIALLKRLGSALQVG